MKETIITSLVKVAASVLTAVIDIFRDIFRKKYTPRADDSENSTFEEMKKQLKPLLTEAVQRDFVSQGFPMEYISKIDTLTIQWQTDQFEVRSRRKKQLIEDSVSALKETLTHCQPSCVHSIHDGNTLLLNNDYPEAHDVFRTIYEPDIYAARRNCMKALKALAADRH